MYMQQEINQVPAPSRDETRQVIYKLNSLGVTISLENGRAIPSVDASVMPIEAARLWRDYRMAILAYLQTPPTSSSPCAACGGQEWLLNNRGIWLCRCYYSPARRLYQKIKAESLF